ncbi:unnamed protein product, partial [Ectocarpus fasciculatus]
RDDVDQQRADEGLFGRPRCLLGQEPARRRKLYRGHGFRGLSDHRPRLSHRWLLRHGHHVAAGVPFLCLGGRCGGGRRLDLRFHHGQLGDRHRGRGRRKHGGRVQPFAGVHVGRGRAAGGRLAGGGQRTHQLGARRHLGMQ